MEIKIDLYKDWSEIILKEIEDLKKKGFKFESFGEWKRRKEKTLEYRRSYVQKEGSSIENLDQQIFEKDLLGEYKGYLIFLFLNMSAKLVDKKPRNIKFPQDFHCPKNHFEGYVNLINKVRKGGSLFPHLSRKVFFANYSDGLLFHWGIHHFHLGMKQDRENKFLVERTGQILYAMVTDEDFYVIRIDEHGKWTDKGLLEIMVRNYPDFMNNYKLKGINEIKSGITERDVKNLRKKNVYPMTEIDGDVYSIIGGGVVGSGLSSKAVFNCQKSIFFLKEAEKIFVREFPKMHEHLKEKFHVVESKISLKMEKVEKDRVTVVCRDYNFYVSLHFDRKGGFDKIIIHGIE